MSSLSNATDLLNCFSAETPELRVSSVARQLGLPKSTVTRLFKEMLRHGLVEQDVDSRAYRPGPLAFRLGGLYQAHLGILDLVEAAVGQLVTEFGLTGYIGVLDRADLVILRVRQGWYPVRIVLEAGYRLPAFTTAIGRALLARLRDAQVTALHPPLMHLNATGLTLTIDELLRDLAETRRVGWVEAANFTFSGFGAIGVSVERPGQQALAFCLSFPTNELFGARRGEMIERLVESASAIGARIDDRFWLARSAAGRRLAPPAQRTRAEGGAGP